MQSLFASEVARRQSRTAVNHLFGASDWTCSDLAGNSPVAGCDPTSFVRPYRGNRGTIADDVLESPLGRRWRDGM
jgi:hypothetical protein